MERKWKKCINTNPSMTRPERVEQTACLSLECTLRHGQFRHSLGEVLFKMRFFFSAIYLGTNTPSYFSI